MADHFTNFASSTLAGGAGGIGTALGPSDTTLYVATSTGALFPSSFPFQLILSPTAAAPEVVQVTGRTADTLTIVRAQESTTALTWVPGTFVLHSITAGTMNNLWAAFMGDDTPGLFTNLTVSGTSSLDGGAITTNGTGVITAVGAILGTSGLVSGGTTSLDGGDITSNGSGVLTVEKLIANTSGVQVTGGITSLDNGYINTDGVGTLKWGSGTNHAAIDAMGAIFAEGIAAPTVPTLALAGSGSTLGIGVYKYAIVFISQFGNTVGGAQATITTTSGHQAVNLSAIPTGPAGILARGVYRTAVGGSTFSLVAIIADNTTTTYSDTLADGSLGAGVPTHPSLGGLTVRDYTGAAQGRIFGDGAIYFDGGSIVSDGNGELTIDHINATGTGISNKFFDIIHLFPHGVSDVFQFNSLDGSFQAYEGVENTGASNPGWYVWDANNSDYIIQSATANAIQITGTITTTGPLTLIGGHQETGVAGIGSYTNAGSGAMDQGVNFKATMTNIPSSITLNSTTNTNANTPVASNIKLTGFLLTLTSVGSGYARWYGTYTTVGNCLLAVDLEAGTFDHHCDGTNIHGVVCDAVHKGVAISDGLTRTVMPDGQTILGYSCPDCHSVEWFNMDFTVDDETPKDANNKADTFRAQQAVYIRQLASHLGLPLA